MRRTAFILLLLILASCTDNSYRGSVDYSLSGYESYPVLVSVGTVQKTKGYGPIDYQDKWMDADKYVYIYGFRHDSPDFTVMSYQDKTKCLVDASSDKAPSRKGGRRVMVTKDDPFVIWDDSAEDRPVFPEGTEPYRFYAYYIDDCLVKDSEIQRDDSSIKIPVTIDGTQDIMSGRSEIRDELFSAMNLSEVDLQNMKSCAFSAYTSNRDVHPALYFRHELVRVKFEAYPATEAANEVFIQKVVVNENNKGWFTVAHKDESKIGVDFSGNNKYDFELREENAADELKTDFYMLKWEEGDEYKEDVYEHGKVKIGGSLLLPPAESYTAGIKLMKKINDVACTDSSGFTIASKEGMFMAGKTYVVRISVNGLSEVKMDAYLEGWVPGDDYYYDEDEDIN